MPISGSLRLVNTPLILRYIIEYFIGTEMLPDSRGLKEALEVVLLAQKELPATMVISVNVMDEFSAACKECFCKSTWGIVKGFNDGSDEEATSEPQPKKRRTDDGESTSDWGVPDSTSTTDAGWGDTAGDGGGWGAPSEPGAWGTLTDAWGDNAAAALPTMTALVYPPSLPSSYSVGIIEQSFRRVKNVVEPSPSTADEKSALKVWEAQFHRVTLEPWLEVNEDEDRPKILESSVGRWTLEEGGDGFNPRKDDIEILVTKIAADALLHGMGLDGKWVQLVSKDESEGLQNVWFVEEVAIVIPSYLVGSLRR